MNDDAGAPLKSLCDFQAGFMDEQVCGAFLDTVHRKGFCK
jgi:hypothetical protein